MEKVSLDGKTYIKATKIARDLGYTADYVGQLCRSGKVDAQLVGRSWFVEENSIQDHKENRYRSSKAQSKKHIKESVASVLEEETSVPHFYKKSESAYAYENDEADLIPTPSKGFSQKLPVELADAKKVGVRYEKSEYDFQTPQRPEIQFHGTLVVSDFEETEEQLGEKSEDGVTHVAVANKERSRTIAIKVDKRTPRTKKKDANAVVVQKNFVKKLEEKKTEVSVPKQQVIAIEESQNSKWQPVAIISLTASSLALVFLMLGLEVHIEAVNDVTLVEYTFSFEDIFALAVFSQ